MENFDSLDLEIDASDEDFKEKVAEIIFACFAIGVEVGQKSGDFSLAYSSSRLISKKRAMHLIGRYRLKNTGELSLRNLAKSEDPVRKEAARFLEFENYIQDCELEPNDKELESRFRSGFSIGFASGISVFSSLSLDNEALSASKRAKEQTASRSLGGIAAAQNSRRRLNRRDASINKFLSNYPLQPSTWIAESVKSETGDPADIKTIARRVGEIRTQVKREKQTANR